MPTEQSINLRLTFPGEPNTTATGEIHDWSVMDRLLRGAVGLGLSWCAAGVAIFMPILHFVLVPSLLVGGPFVGVFRFTEKARLKTMKGACPRCKVDRTFALNIRFNGKRSFTCDQCGNLIELDRA